MALPNPGLTLEPGRTALVLTDLQNDFLSPGGNGWAPFAESYARNGTVENLGRLLKAAKVAGLLVLISPHYYYPTDKDWTAPGSAAEMLMAQLPVFQRRGPLTLDGFAGSGADFPEQFKPYILDSKTVILSPHKVYSSSTNDLVLQLRKRRIEKVPHEKTNPIRTILVHQLLSERRFFAQFVGTEEPSVEELLPAGEKPTVSAYLDKYIWLGKRRLTQLAQGTAAWWLEQRPFFGGLQRERIWVFWRRVLHTCHHRTQVQTWLGLAGHEPVPAIYGPSGDMKWDEADPTYSLEAAKRSG